jgi:hypothetical protein
MQLNKKKIVSFPDLLRWQWYIRRNSRPSPFYKSLEKIITQKHMPKFHQYCESLMMVVISTGYDIIHVLGVNNSSNRMV